MQTPPPPSTLPPYSGRLAFEADAFVYGGKRYAYKDVRHVDFEHEARRTALDQPVVRMEYSSKLSVGMADGKWVSLRLIALMRAVQKTHNKVWHDAMIMVANRLSVLTFDVRMDALMREVGARKFIRQGAYQVTTSGDLYKRFAFCLNMRSEMVNNLLFPDKLVSVRKPKRWWKRMLWGVIHALENIDLTRDRDCFLYFLRFYTGLYWQSEPLRLWRGRAADGSYPGTKAGPDAAGSGAKQEVPVQPKAVATSAQHLATLGLTVDATWDEVRSAYRQLARQYHPDLMRGRGANVAAMAVAEETLKGINQAYGWLEDFYKLKPKR